MGQIKRTHDTLYLSENRYLAPKQIHLELIALICGYLDGIHSNQKTLIGDFGCAAGEFEYALQKHFLLTPEKYENIILEGYELLEVLVNKARKEVPGVKFCLGSVEDKSTCQESRLDVTLMTGVLCIFDRFEPILDNAIFWTKNKGRVFVHSLFNNYPVDVNVKYNLSTDYGSGNLESGWNIFSKDSVSRWLSQHKNVESFKFHDFQIAVDIPKNIDPVRSWTFLDVEGRRLKKKKKKKKDNYEKKIIKKKK